MKKNNIVLNNNKLIGLLILFVLFVFSFNSTKVYAQETNKIEENNYTISTSSNIEALTFFEKSNSITPSWYSYELVINCDNEDYSGYNRTKIDAKYPTGSVENLPVNAEKFALNATDGTGITIKLEPVDDLLSANQVSGNGSTTVVFNEESVYGGILKKSTDVRLISNIDLMIRPVGALGNVWLGKIIYRCVPSSQNSWNNSDWNYMNLENNAKITFPADSKVQIVVIQEVKETKGLKTHFYRLKGIYRLDIY